MTNILLLEEDSYIREGLEHQIRSRIKDVSIKAIEDYNVLIESITIETKLILLNYYGDQAKEKEEKEKIIYQIKQINNQIKIILLTVCSEDEVIHLKNKIEHIIYKPINLGYLNKLQELLEVS